MTRSPSPAHVAFRAARDLLLRHRDDPDAAYAAFSWPELPRFNWALDWFDVIGRDNHRPALIVATPDGWRSRSFADLVTRSNQVANTLCEWGLRPGDRVLLLLDNRPEVWELLLALLKLRAVAVPVFTELSAAEINERADRAGAAHVVATADLAARLPAPAGPAVRVVVDGRADGWHDYADTRNGSELFTPVGPTAADEIASLFFTSGTTSRPKLVAHTQASYAVGHLSSMYWNGLRPGDVHVNVAAPGWAKHPWSSFYAPWNAEATIVAIDTRDAAPPVVFDTLERAGATSFCAPPTIWRSLVRAGLPAPHGTLREAVSVGEPLTDDIVGAVAERWGVRVRNGYGQSEVTAMAGVTPATAGDPTVLGRPLPGYRLLLVRPGSDQVEERFGELCLDLTSRPAGLMHGYLDESGPAARALDGRFYRTGDLARREPDGTLVFVGRIKDVFEGTTGRLVAPARIEGHLVGHPAVDQAAVVQAVDDGVRVAKAFVLPATGWAPDGTTADVLFGEADDLALVEFVPDLPRTESGKIHRELLRGRPRVAAREHRADRRRPDDRPAGLAGSPFS